MAEESTKENNVTGTATEDYQDKITKMTTNLTSMAKVIALFCEARTEDASTKETISSIVNEMID